MKSRRASPFVKLFRKSTEKPLSAIEMSLLAESGFDGGFYLSQTKEGQLNGLSPEEHYHLFGWKAGLDPAEWFSTAAYLQINPDVANAGINPFLHFARHGKMEGRATNFSDFAPPHHIDRANDIARSVLSDSIPDIFNTTTRTHAEFDCSLINEHLDHSFYARQVGVTSADRADLARHFLEQGWRLGLDPRPDFSTRLYLEDHPDVAAADINPFLHFLHRGNEENRSSRPSEFLFSASRLADGQSEWRHYEYVARRGQRPYARPRLELLDFTVALAGSSLADTVLDCRLSRTETEPTISVIMPCWEEAVVTAECLHSVFQCSAEIALEIILVDNGSKDEFFEKVSKHPDIRYIRFNENIGFGPASNAGAREARGKYLLLLNNDTQIAPGCLSTLVSAIEGDDRVAAVGPKIISFDGRLQEAGAIIAADGTGQFIGFGADPEEPRFSYRRFVEHLSAAALMVRKDIFSSLGGFDDVYAPAYCEDADFAMKLKRDGYRILYEPGALVAHHLSKTTTKKKSDTNAFATKMKLVTRNRDTFVRRWASELVNFDIRTIAFYLPQYHPIPENDLWWGKGFTEWRNLSKAKPNFAGHRQPRYPADLGYYDLRAPQVMMEQAALAERYGINGFCYYYYRFGDKRLLEHPIERMLKTGRPKFPFCLCWANENWSRRWDGEDQDLLMEQKYGEDDAIGFAEDTARYFQSASYLTVDAKPLILFYRLQEIPNPKRYVAICRNTWKNLGFHDVMVAMVESFDLSASPVPPNQFGADITVEFPAHGMVHDPALPVRRTNHDWTGAAHDYRELARAFMTRDEAGFKRMRSVLVGWDTTPRHPTRSLVLENSTPGAFQAWLEWTYQRTREQNFGEERIVFINAWNEWCEGSYLEPDADFGHAYLQAVKNAQETVALGGKCFVETH